MNRSKYKIRRALEAYPGIQLRKIADPKGDTGSFPMTTYPSLETSTRINQALRAEGIVTLPQGVNNIVMTQWGLHIYYNIPSLVQKTGVDKRNSPWRLKKTGSRARNTARARVPLPMAYLNEPSLLAIPSNLTDQDEQDIIHAFDKVLTSDHD